MKGSPTAQVHFDGVTVPDSRRVGDEGQGFTIALSALDSGQLGIAACAIGVAQAALDEALRRAGWVGKVVKRSWARAHCPILPCPASPANISAG